MAVYDSGLPTLFWLCASMALLIGETALPVTRGLRPVRGLGFHPQLPLVTKHKGGYTGG
jgi:hypothetical protein